MWMIINGRFDDVNLFVFLILSLHFCLAFLSYNLHAKLMMQLLRQNEVGKEFIKILP